MKKYEHGRGGLFIIILLTILILFGFMMINGLPSRNPTPSPIVSSP